ncbi:MAG: chemotaxis protein CheA, partial [Alphaproteobacteria bacterium]|nr:chemotaxis protein CheA [Alphaproteobacteria bacterium]
KGRAESFGCESIAEFTPVVEFVLEKARDGELKPTEELTSQLLQSVDIISEMVKAVREGTDVTPEGREDCLAALQGYIENPDRGTAVGLEPTSTSSPESRLLQITFKPKPSMPATGSDAANIIRELANLGEIEVSCHTDEVPLLSDIDPEKMYLSWDIQLSTDATTEEIEDVFVFVEDDAEISIETRAAVQSEQQSKSKESETSTTGKSEEKPKQQINKKENAEANKESIFIRVAIDKVDQLINLIGELVTTNAMVEQCSKKLDADENQTLKSAVVEMSSHTRNLQEAIMGIRMMPIDFAFSRFPRTVRDTASKLGKQVNLETTGNQTELDKTVIEKIVDPLTHLVRNAVDHGIELPERRQECGKPAEGTIKISAYHRGGNVVIEIQDDGAGLNREKILKKAIEKELITTETAADLSDEDVWNFIFDSGFSTADKVTDVSGRGVGMDVVRKNIQALGGAVHIQSEIEKGTCFTVSLPLTLAIVDGMALRLGRETYIIPILNIIESIRLQPEQCRTMQDGVEIVDIRGEYFPLLRLSEVFGTTEENTTSQDINAGITVVVESDQTRLALQVDELLGEHQVVIKNVEDNYRKIQGISGATILGDGRVAFIIDLSGLVKLARENGRFAKASKFGALKMAQTTQRQEEVAA